MVNLATYIGSNQAGLPGAIISTIAVVLPSFFIILLIMGLSNKALKNMCFQALLRGVKPSVIGIMLATGVSMMIKNSLEGSIKTFFIYLVLVGMMYFYKYFKNKKLSPILLIVFSVILGIVVY